MVGKQAIGCYVRVSTTGQNLDGQRGEIESWLSGQGINPKSVNWYVDRATGNNLKRPGFEQLQRDIFAGKVRTVVVYKLDRLSRSLRDGINTLTDWCEKGLRVVAVTQQLDFNGAVGKLVAAVLLAVAEMEQETRRERQAAGIAAARRRGVYKGRAAGTLKADPARVRVLKEKGLTADEIAASLKISRRSVFNLLHR